MNMILDKSYIYRNILSFFFFFNDPPPTKISPLPLHDALPIYPGRVAIRPLGDRLAVLRDRLQTGEGHLMPVGRSQDDRDHPGAPRHVTLERALHLLLEADRKSTRLNSSHLVISYAVFCLKKKK